MKQMGISQDATVSTATSFGNYQLQSLISWVTVVVGSELATSFFYYSCTVGAKFFPETAEMASKHVTENCDIRKRYSVFSINDGPDEVLSFLVRSNNAGLDNEGVPVLISNKIEYAGDYGAEACTSLYCTLIFLDFWDLLGN